MQKKLLAVPLLALTCSLFAGGPLSAAPADKPSPSPSPAANPAVSPRPLPSASPSASLGPAPSASPTATPKPGKTPKPPKPPKAKPFNPAKDPAPAKPSGLEADATGWTNLTPDPDLHGWKRVAYANKPIDPKVANPWSVLPGTDVLHCAKVATDEMFLNEQPFGDGIFHVEWRFTKAKAKGKDKDFHGGVFVRTLEDGKIWHIAQAGGVKAIGSLYGNTLQGSKMVPFKVADKVPARGNPPGEWNTYEISCKGKEITLWVNGAVTATWKDCQVPRGMVGLAAEGSEIEFQNLEFKETKQ